MSTCPNPEFHGKPFRYCSCGWTEAPAPTQAPQANETHSSLLGCRFVDGGICVSHGTAAQADETLADLAWTLATLSVEEAHRTADMTVTPEVERLASRLLSSEWLTRYVAAHVRTIRADAERDALLSAADAIQAMHPGEVKNSVTFLRERAGRVE